MTSWDEIDDITHSNAAIDTMQISPNVGFDIWITFDLGKRYSIGQVALWNFTSWGAVNLFAVHANGMGLRDERGFYGFNAKKHNRTQKFVFQKPISTRRPQLRISSKHLPRGTNDPHFTRLGEIAFQRVPFEFGFIPGIIGIIAVGGVQLLRRPTVSGRKSHGE